MYYAMCGQDDGRRLHEISRTGRSVFDEETSYGPNWVAIEIEKGENGQHLRAKSLEPVRSEPPGTTAGSSARQPHSARGPPLRWPSHQQHKEAFGSGSESGSLPPHFRGANGLADVGGLNGLGIWRSHFTSRTRSPSVNRDRAKTPERSNVERQKTPRTMPQTPSTGGWVSRSPPGFPGLATYSPAPQPPLPEKSTGGPAFDTTQPKKAPLDATREKGADFPRTPSGKGRSPEAPRTPQAKAKTPEANNGSSKARGVWSKPSEAMKFGSPGVEVFSL